MLTLELLRSFFGWCAVLNMLLLMFSTGWLVVLRNPIAGIHSKLFKIDPAELDLLYFRYLATFKVLIIVFNLVPYLVLRLCL